MLSTLAIVLLAVAIGFALFDAATGQWIVIAGGIVALILRIDSRMLFGAALFCLVMIPIMTVAGENLVTKTKASVSVTWSATAMAAETMVATTVTMATTARSDLSSAT